jgi:hypothetical protein
MWWTAAETTAGLWIFFSPLERLVKRRGGCYFFYVLMISAHLDGFGLMWKHVDKASGTLLRAHTDGEDTRTETNQWLKEELCRTFVHDRTTQNN